MDLVAVLGSSGFVGSAVVDALESHGAIVRRIQAPRLTCSGRSLEELQQALDGSEREVSDLRAALAGASVIVNAAGMATATSDGDGMFGANALLPGLVLRAAPQSARVVHISSAAVQGRRDPLDESTAVAPFSAYSLSKALGEALIASDERTVMFRPTSVQGPGRDVTAQLIRVLRSPLLVLPSPGDRPTPQVQLANVADAVAYVALTPERPPKVVLQPSEGVTTRSLVELLTGRKPILVPALLCRLVVGSAFRLARLVPRAQGLARRLELLWFGQSQKTGWLTERWSPPKDLSGWKELRT